MTMRILLALFLVLAAAGAWVFYISHEDMEMAQQGYTKVCGVLPEGQVCSYCKCPSGPASVGIGSAFCPNEDEKPVCRSAD